MQFKFQRGKESSNKAREIFDVIITENLPKIMKSTPEIQEASGIPSRINNKKRIYLDTLLSNCWKPKIKRKPYTQPGRKDTLQTEVIITVDFSFKTLQFRTI